MALPGGAEWKGNHMKKLLLAAGLAALMSAGAVQAGGLAAEVVEDVIEVKPASSVSPWMILGLIVLVGLVASQSDSDGPVKCAKAVKAC